MKQNVTCRRDRGLPSWSQTQLVTGPRRHRSTSSQAKIAAEHLCMCVCVCVCVCVILFDVCILYQTISLARTVDLVSLDLA